MVDSLWIAGCGETKWLESHAADAGTRVVKSHAFMRFSRKWLVRVAEIAVIHLLPPLRKHLVQMMHDPPDGALPGEIQLVKDLGYAQRIHSVIQRLAPGPARPVLAPRGTIALQIRRRHAAVRAITMQKETPAQLQMQLMTLQHLPFRR